MTEQVRMFLEYANEAATKIREIYHIFGGYDDESSPEDGLLGKGWSGRVNLVPGEMISIYLEPITGKELHSDDLNNMTVELMYVDKKKIRDFIEKYCQ